MEIEVETARSYETLVGAIYVDASGNVVSSDCEQNVASYYSQKPKRFQCILATSTNQTTPVYRTPAASFQGQFISFGQPNAGGNPSIPWTASMRANTTSAASPLGGMAVLFDQTSKAGSSVCSTSNMEAPDAEVFGMVQSRDTYFSASGVTTQPLEGSENYMHLCAVVTTGTTMNIEGTDEAGALGKGTVISATLMQ